MNIGLDVNNDWAIVDGNWELIGDRFGTQQREVQEHWSQRLKTFFGEVVTDTTLGVPYLQEFFEKGQKISVLESILINESLNTPGIIRLLEFNMDLDKGNRILKVSAEAETIEGTVNFDEEIP